MIGQWQTVKIKVLDIPVKDGSSSFLDPDFLEPKDAFPRSTELTLKAQVRFRRQDRYSPSAIGDIEKTDGYIAIKTKDYETLSPTINKGSIITFVSGNNVLNNVDYEIVEILPTAFFNGKSLMTKLVFRENVYERQDPNI